MTKPNPKNVFDCPVYQKHFLNIQKQTAFLLEKLDIEMPSSFIELDEVLKNKIEPDLSAAYELFTESETYSASFKELADKYNFPNNRLYECRNALEMAAYSYLTSNAQFWLKDVLKEIEKGIDGLEGPIQKLDYRLKPLIGLGPDIDVLFDQAQIYDLFEKTQRNLHELSSLKHKLRDSMLGQKVRLGDKTPWGNPGLKPFIRHTIFIWGEFLGRDYKQRYDGISGRKQLLEFIFDCIQPLHPALPYETVDNALKKLIADVRLKVVK